MQQILNFERGIVKSDYEVAGTFSQDGHFLEFFTSNSPSEISLPNRENGDTVEYKEYIYV